MKWMFCAATAALASGVMAQSTWHVDVHASGPGDGSLANPFASIQFAHDAATTLDYDTLLVAPGVYRERVHVTKHLTVRSSHGPLATVIRPATPGDSVDLDAPGEGGLSARLVGFTVHKVGNGETQSAVRGSNGTVRHCILLGNGTGFGALADFDLAIQYCTSIGHRMGIVEAPYFGLMYVDSTIAYACNEEDAQFLNGNWATNCCFGDGQFPIGMNFPSDPQFVDVAGRDLHLAAGSPCIGAGSPTTPGDPFGPHDEIGALAHDPSYAPFTTYCTAKINSLGCVPSVGASGTPSMSSGQPFTITCANELNQKLGLFFYSFAPKNAAYQGGYLCVQSPVRRTAASSSGGTVGGNDCSGVYAYDFNALIAGDAAIEPDVEIFGQFWSRDPAASFTTNRSNAIRFRVLP